LLPPSALDILARMSVEYPMLFELRSPGQGKRTHCGVLEFSAEEGRCYIPFWMMQNLFMGEGSLVTVKNVSLPKAQFVKFRAQSVDFLEISNPRVVLEQSLRKFTCVTVGDHIMISYLDKNYYLEIREVKPSDAASIIETDCNVDFEEPVGYKESEYAKYEKSSSRSSDKLSMPPRTLQKGKVESIPEAAPPKFQPFVGSAKRLDGKAPPNTSEASADIEKKNGDKVGPNTNNNSSINNTAPVAPPRVSVVGEKYSKKKVAVSAFNGVAHKLK